LHKYLIQFIQFLNIMGILSWLKNTEKLHIDGSFYKKYRPEYFKDISIQEELAKNGFAVRNLLNKNEIEPLKKGFKMISENSNNEMTDLFWNSGRAKDTAIRNLARSSIDTYFKPRLNDFFIPEKVDLMGGVYVAKPLGKESALNPHQDSSHVEEDKFMSVYAWCTLTDVNKENGALHVIPGSHKFGNTQRSLNIPWQFEPYCPILWQYAVPVNMKAGEVIFFDSAMIHCSPPNFGKELRLAVNFFIKPKEAEFLHYFQDENTPPGMVEKFAVDMNFFYDKDFQKRPSSEYPHRGFESYRDLKLSERKITSWCKQYAKEFGSR